MKIEKAYFTLAEVCQRWGRPTSDLAYMAENGELRLSSRVFGIPVEISSVEEDPDGTRFTLPHTRTRYSGLLDLHAHDAFRVFRGGSALVAHFIVPDGDQARLMPDVEPVEVRRLDLLVRKEERDRIELERGFSPKRRPGRALRPANAAAPAATTSDFRPSPDYRQVRIGRELYQFGAIQAEVIRALHAAHRSGACWQSGKAILTEAGSRCLRMADIFKSNPAWGRLILSNQRGLYRLAIAENRDAGRRSGVGSPGDAEGDDAGV